MARRVCWLVMLLLFIAGSISAQQTLIWKKDHVYAGANGPEIAVIVPPPTDTTPPSAPAIQSATTGYTSATVTWSASTDTGGSGLAGYKLYRQAGSGASLPVGTVGPGTLTFTDQPLKPNISYTYRVVAFDNAENHSTPSSGVNVQTSTDTTAPTAPASMAIAYTSPTSVSMTWTAATDSGSGLQGYRVYREGTLISPLIPAASQMFVDTTLAADTAYTYMVTAVDNVGNESAGISRSVFRDDFNRSSGTGLNSPYWTINGNWSISSSQAYLPNTTTSGYDALTSKSFNSFTLWSKTTQRGTSATTHTASGVEFWADSTGTEKYAVVAGGSGFGLVLQYITASGTTTLQTSNAVYPPYLLSVDADAVNRIIKVSVDGLLQFTYTDTNSNHRNNGPVGIRGVPAASPDNYDIYADDFIVAEKDGSLTSTDIVPSNVRLTYLSTTSVEVDWDPSADIGNGVAGYEVYRGGTLVSGGSLVSGTTFQNTGLTVDTSYGYVVKSVDNSGTRYASPTKTAFRDDFNRASLLSDSGWSSAGSWAINSGQLAANNTSPTDALTSASFVNVRATATVSLTNSDYWSTYSGITFWNNGPQGYRVLADGSLTYFNGGTVYTLAPAISGNGVSGTVTLRVEANATNRTINTYVNGTLQSSYVETDSTRPNSGPAGITGYVGLSDACYTGVDCSGVYANASNFIVEEQ